MNRKFNLELFTILYNCLPAEERISDKVIRFAISTFCLDFEDKIRNSAGALLNINDFSF